MSLQRLFFPSSIAVIGASPQPEKVGNVLVRNLSHFHGKVFPVHPHAKEVGGHRVYSSISEIPTKVDLALLAIPPRAVPAELKDLAKAGVGAAIIHSGGWAESGETGRILQNEIEKTVQETGIRILGPNTAGFLVPKAGTFATFVSDISTTVHPGSISIVAQSGGVNFTLAFMAQSEGLGVRLGVGLGNAIDVDFAEVISFLANDPETKAIVVAIEGVRDGRALYDAVCTATRKCPVIALKVGRTDVSTFAKSHTGAIAGSRKVACDALRQAGAIVVDSLSELLDAARALSLTRLTPKTSIGVGVITGQAGPGILLADALAANQISMPTLSPATQEKLKSFISLETYRINPVDTGRPEATFGDVCKTVASEKGIDLLAISLLHEPDAVDPVAAFGDLRPTIFVSQGPTKAIDRTRQELAKRNIPLFSTPERAVIGVSALVEDSKRQYILHSKTAGSKSSFVSTYKPQAQWTEVDGKSLLDEIGFKTPRRMLCMHSEEAVSMLTSMKPPLVVKMVHPDVLHKTEKRGVHLNIRDRVSMLKAIEVIHEQPGAKILVEEMALEGPELFIGAKHDDVFGPIVMLGRGGTGIEREDDSVIRVAPFSLTEAKTMLGQLKSAWKFRGYRGAPGVNEDDLAKHLVQFGELILNRKDILEIEVNPLRVTELGLIVLDALVVKNEK